MNRRWNEVVGAVTLLTRLPVGGLAAPHPQAAACVWAYPLAGLVVGGIGAAVLGAARLAGLGASLAAVLALAATALATGALHEDGLADTADGLGGGRTREAKLLIMRDSRIGSFGALALILSVALRAIPLATTQHPVVAMVSAAVLGRAAMLLPLVLPPARTDGLAAALATGPARSLWVGLILAAPVAALAPASAGAALAAGAAMALLARRQLGGYTGDVLGAAEQLGECAALMCF